MPRTKAAPRQLPVDPHEALRSHELGVAGIHISQQHLDFIPESADSELVCHESAPRVLLVLGLKGTPRSLQLGPLEESAGSVDLAVGALGSSAEAEVDRSSAEAERQSLRLVLEQKADGEVDIVARSSETEHFRGNAGYWLGAEQPTLRAVATLCRRGLVAMVPFWRENSSAVHYRITLLNAAVSARDDVARWYEWPCHCGKQGTARSLRIFFHWIFDKVVSLPLPVASGSAQASSANFDASDFFGRLRPDPCAPMLREGLPGLVPTLRPYQRRAVKWMVLRESGIATHEQRRQAESAAASLWCRLLSSDHKPLWFCAFSGHLSLQSPPPASSVAGGVLADQMGLGKTVEVLALILAHPRDLPDARNTQTVVTETSSTNYATQTSSRIAASCGFCEMPLDTDEDQDLIQSCSVCGTLLHAACCAAALASSPKLICPHCRVDHVMLPTKATLIVCPASILAQWSREIQRHTAPVAGQRLRVAVYHGVRFHLERLSTLRTALVGGCSAGCRKRRRLDRAGGSAVSSADRNRAAESSGDTNSALGRSSPNICEIEREAGLLWAEALGAHDIVLTTYAALRADLGYSDDLREAISSNLRSRNKHRARFQGDTVATAGPRRFIPTPLKALDWWRVCLDEAQLIESGASGAAKMAVKLKTTHRWCVTGTPIGRRGLSDLWGLLHFLQLKPYCDRAWWTHAIERPLSIAGVDSSEEVGTVKLPYERLLAAFRGVLWRNRKSDVKHELSLPKISHVISRVAHSAVERHYYERVREEILREELGAVGGPRSRGAVDDVSNLMRPLLRLRQAAVHPQIGVHALRRLRRRRRGAVSSAARRKITTKGNDKERRGEHALNPMSMREIRDELVTKEAVDAEEAQRSMLFELHGIAALQILLGDTSGAEVTYIRALRQTDKYDPRPELPGNVGHAVSSLDSTSPATTGAASAVGAVVVKCKSCGTARKRKSGDILDDGITIRIKVDRVQRLHATYNLQELLKKRIALSGSDCMPGLEAEVHRLSRRIGALRQEHMDIHEQVHAAASNEALSACQAVENAKSNEVAQSKCWWLTAIDIIEKNGGAATLIDHLQKDVSYGGPTKCDNVEDALVNRFTNVSGLRFVLQQRLDDIRNKERVVVKYLTELLQRRPSSAESKASASCSRCRQYHGKTGPTCRNCIARDACDEYERSFFNFRMSRRGGQANLLFNLDGTDVAARIENAEFNADGAAFAYKEAGYAFRAEAEVHAVLRKILQMAKQYPPLGCRGKARDGRTCMCELCQVVGAATFAFEAIDACPKVYFRDLLLKADDELEMSIGRMRLATPSELAATRKRGSHTSNLANDGLEANVVQCVAEIPERLERNRAELVVFEARFNRHVERLRFLRNQLGGENNCGDIEARASSADLGCPVPESNAGLKRARRNHGDTVDKTWRCCVCLLTAEEKCKDLNRSVASPHVVEGCAEGPKERDGSSAATSVLIAEANTKVVLPNCAHDMCVACFRKISHTHGNSNQEHRLSPSRRRGIQGRVDQVKCPTCRTKSRVVDVKYVSLLHPESDATPSSVDSVTSEKRAILNGTMCEEPLGAAREGGGLGTAKTGYGSKIDAIVRDLVELERADPSEIWSQVKSLVFSQWEDALSLVEIALRANRIFSVRLGGGRCRGRHRTGRGIRYEFSQRLDTFRSDPTVRVLLIPVKSGANGLNLIEATHVFFVEPLLSLAIEHQAYSRVHRIGQTKPTYVHRYVVEDTVESAIVALAKRHHSLGKHSSKDTQGGATLPIAETEMPPDDECNGDGTSAYSLSDSAANAPAPFALAGKQAEHKLQRQQALPQNGYEILDDEDGVELSRETENISVDELRSLLLPAEAVFDME